MDNVNINRNNSAGEDPNQAIPLEDSDAPIPLDLDEPISLGGGAGPKSGVSHAPLDRGGGPAAAPASI